MNELSVAIPAYKKSVGAADGDDGIHRKNPPIIKKIPSYKFNLEMRCRARSLAE
jgi:hypothetical protein